MSWLEWCWYDKVDCKCKVKSVEELASYAQDKYTNIVYEYGPGNGTSDNLKEGDVVTRKGSPWKGKSKDDNGNFLFMKDKFEIDCYWLVTNTLTQFGYEQFSSSSTQLSQLAVS